jgi:uncharacterized protein DUF87
MRLNLFHSRTNPQKSRSLILGKTLWNKNNPVIFNEHQRPMHLGILGLSGVGKTYFLEHLIRQDIDRRTGFVLFDVHGDLADNIIAYLAERAHTDPSILTRTILIEPFDKDFSIGFNPLQKSPHTSVFLQAQELAHILRSRWEAKSFGPRTEELLRNALFVLCANDLTLLELPFLLTNTAYRNKMLQSISDQSMKNYWLLRYDRLSDRMRAVLREPLLTRISGFLFDPQIRDIVGQRKSTFSFTNAISASSFVIANLSKGKLGEENSPVLGSLLFTKLELDIMAQAQVPERDRKFFAVYADELQNFTGQTFATLIAEARKYRIAIAAGHQSWRQLSPEMRNAMLGVGSRVFFRLHSHDARDLAAELPGVSPTRLLTLPRGEAIYRTASELPVHFRVDKHRPAHPATTDVEALRNCARTLYAPSRLLIRKDIEDRFHTQLAAHTGSLINRPTE